MTSVRARDVVGFVWRHWRRRPRFVGALYAVMFAAVLCDVFLPVLAGHLIDSLAVTGAAPYEALTGALTALAAFVGLTAAYHVLREAAFRMWIRLASEIMGQILGDALERVQRFSADWHANSFAGATVRKISRGMWAYDLFADTVYYGFFPSTVVLVGITGLLFLRWPLMGAYALTAILLYIAISVLLTMRYVAPAFQVANAADSTVGGAMADTISCNQTVKAFGAEAREEDRFRAISERWRRLAARSWTREVNVGVLQSLLSLLLQVGLLGLALWFWAEGSASAGDVAFVMSSYFLMNGYLRETGQHVSNLQQAVNELEDLVRFEATPLEVADREGAEALTVTGGEIRFERVTFRYGNQPAPLYNDFSLTIAPGEKVALVGSSGSGKSTFVKLVQRLYDLDSGAIAIDGQDIAAATQVSVRRAISLVPQDPVLFHRSLAENIAYARPGASQAEIELAARQARAHGFISRLNDGYATLVGERGVKLSGGERQRVALARAFLADAPILILDEATSSLDTVTETEIQAAIERLMEGRTTIIVAHRLSTIRNVDRILVFRDGRIVEQGTHDALMALEDGHYRRLHAVRAAGLGRAAD